MIVDSTFSPAWWLKNRHAQTIYPTLTNYSNAPIDSYERIELPDGDFIDLAWAINGLSDNSPLVILLHGLGGGVKSVYVAGLMRTFNQQGKRCVLMLFRGASHEPNRKLRAYHSGDTADFQYFLELLAKREPNTQKAVIGVSLGGNVLLKWLGEIGAQSLIQAGVAVSVPFRLDLSADEINKGSARLYQAYLLQHLRGIFLNKLDMLQQELAISKEDLFSLRTIKDFDQKITAPLHGFSSLEAYYQQASSRQYLGGVKTPTLIIHSLDDPFMCPQVIPEAKELSSDITFELSRHGGHVGFISGHIPGQPVYWLEQRISEFVQGG